MTRISCQHLTYRYPNGASALEDVSCHIPHGVTGLVGGNGSGKSTLFRLLSGRLKPLEKTSITIDPALEPQEILYIPEESSLPAYLSPREIFSAVHGVYPERHHELLRLLGIHEYQDKLLKECSLGMKKKVVLALALMRQNRLVLLDEPFNGIDVDTLLTIERLIRDIAQRHRDLCLVIASHHLDFLEHTADHLILLSQGRLLMEGTSKQVSQQTHSKSLLSSYQRLRDGFASPPPAS